MTLPDEPMANYGTIPRLVNTFDEINRARADPNVKSLDEEELEVLKNFFNMTTRREIMEYYDSIRTKMKARNVTYITLCKETMNQ